MGRKLKVYPGEVEEYLKENGRAIPVREIAKYFECSVPTVRKRLNDLRSEGKAVLPTNKGIILVEKVEDEESADLVIKCGKWIVSVFTSMARLAGVTKKPLLAARRVKQLSREDRKELKGILKMLIRAIDTRDVDEEFEPPKLTGRKDE